MVNNYNKLIEYIFNLNDMAMYDTRVWDGVRRFGNFLFILIIVIKEIQLKCD